jgi:hypothetical protein
MLFTPFVRRLIKTNTAAELNRRRTEARRLRSSAGAEWAADKARFEPELSGNQA